MGPLPAAMWCCLPLLALALALPRARAYRLELPIRSTELDEQGYLQWEVSEQSAEDCARSAQTALGGEQVLLMVGKMLKRDGVLRALPSDSSVPVPWSKIPQILHSLLAELVDTPEEAFEIEEAAFGRVSRAAFGSVGVFLLMFPGRNGWRVLAKSLREAWGRGLLPAAQLHLLVHHPDDWQPDTWRDALGDALPLLRGLHWAGGRNRFSRYNRALVEMKPWDNYYHKVFTMLALAEYHSYEYIVSLDDDVLLPPSALAYLIHSGQQADNLNCGVVSPLLQNGVPSVEIFAEEFFSPHEQFMLYRCFGESTADYVGVSYPELEPVPRPWNGFEWYRRVRELNHSNALAHKGLHPVRGNNSCMEVSLALALSHLESEWPRWRTDHALLADAERYYPYFCNNAYLVRRDLYSEVLRQPDLWQGGADEEPLNNVMDERNLPACFVSGSFGIHPAYSTHERHLDMENTAVALVLAVDGSANLSWFTVPNDVLSGQPDG